MKKFKLTVTLLISSIMLVRCCRCLLNNPKKIFNNKFSEGIRIKGKDFTQKMVLLAETKTKTSKTHHSHSHSKVSHSKRSHFRRRYSSYNNNNSITKEISKIWLWFWGKKN